MLETERDMESAFESLGAPLAANAEARTSDNEAFDLEDFGDLFMEPFAREKDLLTVLVRCFSRIAANCASYRDVWKEKSKPDTWDDKFLNALRGVESSINETKSWKYSCTKTWKNPTAPTEDSQDILKIKVSVLFELLGPGNKVPKQINYLYNLWKEGKQAQWEGFSRRICALMHMTKAEEILAQDKSTMYSGFHDALKEEIDVDARLKISLRNCRRMVRGTKHNQSNLTIRYPLLPNANTEHLRVRCMQEQTSGESYTGQSAQSVLAAESQPYSASGRDHNAYTQYPRKTAYATESSQDPTSVSSTVHAGTSSFHSGCSIYLQDQLTQHSQINFSGPNPEMQYFPEEDSDVSIRNIQASKLDSDIPHHDVSSPSNGSNVECAFDFLQFHAHVSTLQPCEHEAAKFPIDTDKDGFVQMQSQSNNFATDGSGITVSEEGDAGEPTVSLRDQDINLSREARPDLLLEAMIDADLQDLVYEQRDLSRQHLNHKRRRNTKDAATTVKSDIHIHDKTSTVSRKRKISQSSSQPASFSASLFSATAVDQLAPMLNSTPTAPSSPTIALPSPTTTHTSPTKAPASPFSSVFKTVSMQAAHDPSSSMSANYIANHTFSPIIPTSPPVGIPISCLAMPDYSPAIPDYSPAKLDYSPAMPDYSPAKPDYSPAMPGNSLAMPDYSPAIPISSSAMPDCTPVMVSSSPTMPISSPAMPDCSTPMAISSPAISTSSSAKPDYSPAIPTSSSALLTSSQEIHTSSSAMFASFPAMFDCSPVISISSLSIPAHSNYSCHEDPSLGNLESWGDDGITFMNNLEQAEKILEKRVGNGEESLFDLDPT